MSRNSKRVMVPGHGSFFINDVDTPPPGQLIKITGGPTTTQLVFTVNDEDTPSVAVTAATLDDDMLTMAQQIAALPTVGAGRVCVIPAGRSGLSYAIFIDQAVTDQAITVAGTFTGGTTPAVTVATTAVGFGPWDGYSEIGYTSKDSPWQINKTGGDVTPQDSWQEDGIDSSVAGISWSMAFNALQYDYDTMKLYHGSNAVEGTNGLLQTSKDGPTATEKALFMLLRNGNKAQVRHWARTSIIGADGESFDTTKLANMPLQAAVLSSTTYAFGQQLSQIGAAA